MKTKTYRSDAWGNPWRGAGAASLSRARLPDHPADRRCTRPGCITILSTYNPGPECYLHSPELPWAVIVAEKIHD